jgi:preprotein translocase subunit SecF
MIRILHDVKIDWLGLRKPLLLISIVLMLAGLASAVARQAVPGGTDAFNLGVDFRGGTLISVDFKQAPSVDAVRDALGARGMGDAVIQQDVNKNERVIIKLAQQGTAEEAQSEAQVDIGRVRAEQALAAFGRQGKLAEGADWEIVSTEAVGPVAGRQLRNQAITVTLLALVGILLYIAFRFEWTYGAAAVVTVFHDVLVTLGFFSVFQWEIDLTTIAALLTLVGFSVNDTIVTFDRVRENLRLRRRASLYDLTNEAINQTLSRTVITGGLVFLSVLALVMFGGTVLRSFSLALFIGVITGTFSTITISNPLMVWWQQRVERAGRGGGGGSPAKAESAPARRAPAGTTRTRAAAR